MKAVAVNSSSIKSVAYDDKTGNMDVQFSSGKTYRYQGVSPEVHRDFMAAESKGKFFASKVRNSFPSQAV